MSTCQATKKDGTSCGNAAKYKHPSDNSPRCGVHMRGVADKETTTTKTKIQAPSSIDLVSLMINRYEERLCKIDIPIESITAVRRLADMNPTELDTFIAGLLKTCPPEKTESGANIDYDRMIIIAGEKYKSYMNAQRETWTNRMIKFYPHCVSDTVSVMETLPVNLDEGDHVDFSENGFGIYYKDVDVIVMNCKHLPQKLMDDWKAVEANVYVGPGSDLFIPPTCLSRKIQNERDVETIMKGIEDGSIDPSKYLALRGKCLGCQCSPYPCHTEVYVEILRRLK